MNKHEILIGCRNTAANQMRSRRGKQIEDPSGRVWNRMGACDVLNQCPLQSSSLPRTFEHDLIWQLGLCRGNQVRMRSSWVVVAVSVWAPSRV